MELNITGKKGVDIQEDFIGIFFEDINYGADGGLYGEMIENRLFEFVDMSGQKDAFIKEYDGLYGWKAYGNDASSISIGEIAPLTTVNPHYLHVQTSAGCGVTNQAYEGLYLEKGKEYRVSFFARCCKKTTLVIAAVERDDASLTAELGRAEVAGVEWKRYELVVKAPKDMRYARFAILFTEDAAVDFDCVSMFPGDAVCGVFRKDLAEKLKALSPKFMRFPGGCVVEGNSLSNRFQWKESVGEIYERRSNWNRWAVHNCDEENGFHSPFSHYNQTLGLGYYEYFLLCEYLGAKAIPVANVGLACQYMSTELVKRTDPAYASFITDVLDLIEFANGAVDTTWGAVRAKMGHPEPFGLEYVGIGNEQWQTKIVDFFERYDDFEKAIHAKYPKIRLIGSAGPTVKTDTYDAAWENYHSKAKENPGITYAVDEHYYMEPEWFLANTHFYDTYARDVKVFSGEYAAHDKEVTEPALRNNMKCALAEAAFLTGVERNADVVYLACYAPLFARLGFIQWHPDLIWFDDRTSYGTPDYYVQQLYGNYTGKNTVESIMDGEKDGIFHIVSEDATKGHGFIKLVNTSEADQEITITYPKSWDAYCSMDVITLSGSPDAVNSIEQPQNVVPNTVHTTRASVVTLPAHTMMVLDVWK